MTDALPLRIFLASPGDLQDERNAVHATVDEHNRRSEGTGGVTYEVVGWDRVRGTVRRPQAAINELINECHFMVVLFKASWGSEPGSPWGYTSGTEEELFTGLMELARAEQPMRDVWVAFLDTSSPDQRIGQLKDQIIDQHSLMFETIRTARDLKNTLAERLNLWAATSVGPKVPLYVDLLPTSGKDVLKAVSLRIRGEKLVELGQPESGRAALEEAAVIGGPDEQLALAAFLRHDGELDRALEQTQRAIDFYSAADDTLHSVAAADAFSAQARVLSAQGQRHDAIGRLEQALTLLLHDDAASEAVRCRILDDLGLAHTILGDLGSARQNFEESLQRRRERLTARDVAQSLINLARLEVAEGELGTAVEYANQVIETLRLSPTTGLHGNAHVLIAQLQLRQGRPADGIPKGKAALAANRQTGNKPGEAISLLVLGQCCRAAGYFDEARSYLLDCVEVNESMGNIAGVEKARWQLDRLNDDDA